MESIGDASDNTLCREPSDCPEYIRCSAPICPLDSDWMLRTYDRGEPTCLFLRETLKQGADERLAANPVYIELHDVCKLWLSAERIAIAKRSEAGMPRGRTDHLKAVLAATSSGSTLDQRTGAAERLAASRRKKGADSVMEAE